MSRESANGAFPSRLTVGATLTGRRLISVLGLVLVTVSVAAIAGCAAPAPEATGPVVIGYLGGLSGRSSGLGLSGRDGTLLAIEQANERDPDRPVVLEVADDGTGDEASVAGVKALAEKGAVVIVGPLTSSSASAAVPVAEQAGIPLLSPTVSSTDFTGLDDMFLRTCADNRLYASILASRVVDAYGPVRVTAIYDLGNRSYSEVLYRHFSETLAARGGRMREVLTFTSGANPDYTALSKRALAEKPDCVLIVANPIDSALVCQRLRLAGYSGHIALSQWGASSNELVTAGGDAVESSLFLDNWDRSSTDPEFLAMVDAFKRRFGYAPGFAAIHAYDATNMALKALDVDSAPVSMKDALLGLGPFKGVQGVIELDEFGDTVRPFYPMTIADGSFAVTGTP